MSKARKTSKRRLDYQPPAFTISTIDLVVELHPTQTKVIAKTHVQRQGQHQQALRLDGVDLQLLELKLDGQIRTDAQVDPEGLTLDAVPDSFELEIHTLTNPEQNTALEGLYLSGGAFCTQCEAEGFRKITYFLDRPDVLARYEVTLIADAKTYPYLLANGNKIDSGELPDGRHWAKWQDPFPKPSYLFALVAGDFDLLSDKFITANGRHVALELYVDKGNLNRAGHAMASLKKAMAWDEQRFGLEYDLDIYMIVAVDFFNMGAMENKGLNVFNSKYVLADPQTATDEDYFNIESVIAHEYFHNWTGNRVTCRDWFQLSLKEGLTVFRDQEFSADMASAAVNRINNVRVIREHQFAEDASPMAHPIRPDEVMEMNNFYTVTVYNKGAEVIRMLQTLIGQQKFTEGLQLYLRRHDGQAVTCDDFVTAMQDASGKDLSHFRRWYAQSGTPELQIDSEYDAANQQLKLTVSQHCPPTADQARKQPLHIPLDLEIVYNDGAGKQRQLLEITQENQQFVFEQVESAADLSLLRNFSAPVRIKTAQGGESLARLMTQASDDFARWDAGQQLFINTLLAMAQQDASAEQLSGLVLEAIAPLLQRADASQDVLAEMLLLPNFETLCQQVQSIQVAPLYQARKQLLKRIAVELQEHWLALYQRMAPQPYVYEPLSVARRRLANLSLQYLAASGEGLTLVQQQLANADNMTDSLGALKAAQQLSAEHFDGLMANFEQRWGNEPLVMDKWFGLKATYEHPQILSRLGELMQHRQFSQRNPNRVRAVMGSFAFYNPMGLHQANGEGYRFLTDYLLELDPLNPQVAARLVTPLTQWRRYQADLGEQMREQLERVAATSQLSSDVYEKVSKSLSS